MVVCRTGWCRLPASCRLHWPCVHQGCAALCCPSPNIEDDHQGRRGAQSHRRCIGIPLQHNGICCHAFLSTLPIMVPLPDSSSREEVQSSYSFRSTQGGEWPSVHPYHPPFPAVVGGPGLAGHVQKGNVTADGCTRARRLYSKRNESSPPNCARTRVAQQR